MLDVVLRRDRAVVSAALVLIMVLAWAYVLWLASDMDMRGADMTGLRMIPAGLALMVPAAAPWTPLEFALVFVMWVVMMIGMMIPSAATMMLIYARVGRQAAAQGKPFAPTAWFATGYLLVWAVFSFLATTVQWALERGGLIDPNMALANTLLGAVILIAAGVYQWTPWKSACLTQCQSPLAFIQRRGGFRSDRAGALRLGLLHGAYCVGCCWTVMTLLFVAGVMSVLWIAALAIFVLAERLAPLRFRVAAIGGILFICLGGWLLALAVRA